MSRPLRIAYPNAWYHVMNRGRRAEKIFVDDHDHHIFIKLLIETSDAWNVRISAYCLMPNHQHMLINTPEANISRVMRHINGVYTQRFNSRHGCDGQLFRGRYKSILIRAHFNEPRNVAIYLLRRLRRDSLSEIGRVFQIDKYSSVSSIIERLKLRIGADPQLKKRIEDLKDRMYM